MTSGARSLRGLRLPRQGEGKRVVLYLHGNAGNLVTHHRVQLYELLAAPPLCCDVVAVDYRGFGKSDWLFPSEESTVADAIAALRGLPEGPKEVIVWGHSLGTGVAVGALHRLAEQAEVLPKGLILEAPLASVPDVVADSVGFLPLSVQSAVRSWLPRCFSAHSFLSKDRVAYLSQQLPIVILHGERDTVVRHSHGQMLARLASIQLHSFQRAHEDIVEDPQLVPILKELFESWD